MTSHFTDLVPEIHIKDAWLLRGAASRHLHELWAKEGEVLADDAWMKQKVGEYNDAWKPLERKILTGMCDVLELKFRHNIIDVYIAPWFFAFSDPLVIGVKYPPDVFVDVLTHELLHCLLTVNNKFDIDVDGPERLNWQALFGNEHDFDTLVHIPVHAALKALYIDVLHEPHRLERDIKRCQKLPPAYSHAWNYVTQHDYAQILQEIHKNYQAML